MVKELIPFRRLSNDLFADVPCKCLDPKWAGSSIAHIMKFKVRLTGYADNNFFDNVNAVPSECACRNCGRKYRAQWLREGVEFEWLEGASVELSEKRKDQND